MLFGSLYWGLQERVHIGFRALGRTVPQGTTRGRLVPGVQVWWYRTRQDPELGCPLGSSYPGGHPASLSPCANTHSRALRLVGSLSFSACYEVQPKGFQGSVTPVLRSTIRDGKEHSPQSCMSISGVTLNKHCAPTATTAVILLDNRTRQLDGQHPQPRQTSTHFACFEFLISTFPNPRVVRPRLSGRAIPVPLYFALSVPLSLSTLPVPVYMGTEAGVGYTLKKVPRRN